MKLSIILAPYDSGYLHGGFGLGPEAIISGGLVEALSLNGHDVTVAEIGEVGNEQRREIATGFAVCRAVATNVDASLAAVEAAGGSVVEGPYDYPGGRRFIFGDPDGNVLGVYQPSDS